MACNVVAISTYACLRKSFTHSSHNSISIFCFVQTRLPRDKSYEAVEQLGTYDANVNAHGEKLVSLNIERILYWLSQGVRVSTKTAQLFGLAGLFPQHPATYMHAWRNRRELIRGLDEPETSQNNSKSEASKA